MRPSMILLFILVGATPGRAQPPELFKVMITEVLPYSTPAVELANFHSASVDLSNHVIAWKTGSGPTLFSAPLGRVLGPREILVVRSPGTPIPGVPGYVSQVAALPPLGVPFGASVSVALIAPTNLVEDEVRLLGLTATQGGSGLGGIFRGFAQPGNLPSGSPSCERLWGLDSDSAGDWVRATVPSMGFENAGVGARTTDPSPQEAFLINEVHQVGTLITNQYRTVELLNTQGTTVDLRDWFLIIHGTPGGLPRRLAPWPGQTLVPAGAYVVLWDSALVGLPPSEMPQTTMNFPVGSGLNGLPISGQGFSIALYDDLGRLVDLVRCTGRGTEMIHNHPRAPSAADDFRGAALRSSAALGIGRASTIDTNSGSDWRPTQSRSMGLPNTAFSDGPGDGAAPDARIHEGVNDGLVVLIDGGTSWAGEDFYLLFSLTPAFGVGPVMGLSIDCLDFFNAFSWPEIPPFGGSLDARGLYRFELPPLALPAGVVSENIVILRRANGSFQRTRVLRFQT